MKSSESEINKTTSLNTPTTHYQFKEADIQYGCIFDNENVPEFLTFQGFINKDTGNDILTSFDNNTTWIHVGPPKEYVNNCGDNAQNCNDSPDSSSSQLSNCPQNQICFISIQIVKPSKDNLFKLTGAYKDLNRIYGFRCISERLTFKLGVDLIESKKYNNSFQIKLDWDRYSASKYPIQTLVFENPFFTRKITIKEDNRNQKIYFAKRIQGYDIKLETLFLDWSFTLINDITTKFEEVAEEKNFCFKLNGHSNNFSLEYSESTSLNDDSMVELTLTSDFGDNIEVLDYIIILSSYLETYCHDEENPEGVVYKRTFSFSQIEPKKWIIYLKTSYMKEVFTFAIGNQLFTIDARRVSSEAVGLKIIKPSSKIGQDLNPTFQVIYVDEEGFPTTYSPLSGNPASIQYNYITKRLNNGGSGSINYLFAQVSGKQDCYQKAITLNPNYFYQISFEKDNITEATIKFVSKEQGNECDNFYFIDEDLATFNCQFSCDDYRVDDLCFENCNTLCEFNTNTCSYTESNNSCYDENEKQADIYSGLYEKPGLHTNYYKPDGGTNFFALESNNEFSLVSQCPVDKPYFSDDYVCVSACPTEKEYYDENYKCYAACPDYRPIRNGKECVYACPTGKRTDFTNNECYLDCNSGYEQDGQCVSICTENKFGDELSKRCVTSCPSGMKSQYAPLRKCYFTCPNFTSGETCMETCNSANEYVQIEGLIKKCNGGCSEYFRTVGSEKHCVTSCDNNLDPDPEEYVDSSDPNNKQCLNSCSDPKFIHYVGGYAFCKDSCNKYTNQIGSEKHCLDTCPDYHHDGTPKTCVSNCMGQQFISIEGGLDYCRDSCTGTNRYVYAVTDGASTVNHCRNGCTDIIRSANNGGTITKYCETECISPKFIEVPTSGAKHCIDTCQSPKYIRTVEDSGIITLYCENSCNKAHFYKDSGSKYCVDQCPMSKTYLEGGECLGSCSESTFGVNIYNFSTSQCLLNCNNLKNYNNVCYDSCSSTVNALYEYNDSCFASCNETTDAIFSHNNQCVSSCPSVSYNNICYNNCDQAPQNAKYTGIDGVCVTACNGSYSRGYTCVSNCDDNEFIENNECVTTCSAFSRGNKCVAQCDDNEFIENNQCVTACSAFSRGNKCVAQCDDNEFMHGNKCVTACPEGMKSTSDKNCVAQCTNYSKGEDCLDECNSFVIPLPGFDPGKGECVDRCPPSLEYYYEQDRVCLTHCPLYQTGFKCLDKCNTFIESSSNRLICKEECTDPKHLNALKTRSICLTRDQTATQTVTINNITFKVPLPCIRMLKEDNSPTDEDCKALCRDDDAFALSLSEHRCVTDCPQERPFFEGSVCVEQCSEYYTRHGECLAECDVSYPYFQELEGKLYCVSSCENDWLPGERMSCYNPTKIECELPEVQFEDRCRPCPIGMLYEKGECVHKCSPCSTIHRLGDCQPCEGVIFEKKCIIACPTGYIVNPNSAKCSKECVKCAEMEMFMDGDQCISKCPEDKFPRGNKCYSCEEVNSFETEQERRICGSCEGSFKNRNGSCTANCSFFTFTKEKQDFCLNCGELFFYKDRCVETCPTDTVTYNHKKECLDLPKDCQRDASKCKRNSTCNLTPTGPKCVCRTGTMGLLCQANTVEIKEEIDPQKVASWSNLTEINTITLQNAFKLVPNSISDKNLLKSLQNLLEQAYTTTDPNIFLLADFALKDTTFEPESDRIQRKKSIITKLLQKATPTPFRSLYTATEYIDYEGENYTLLYSDDISSKINIAECESKLRTHLNQATAQFSYIYLQLNQTTVEAAPAASNTTLNLNTQPHVTVSIYYNNIPQDLSTVCSLENVDVEYEVTPEGNTSEIEKLKDKGVNPFNEQDDFFTDVCSLSNSGSDLTLSKRKELFYVDPAKVCNQQEGQVCSIDQFSGEKVKCTCKGINNNPPSVTDSFATTFFESNFKIIKCYNRFFTREMYLNPGFLLSFGMLLFFYILQNISLIQTFKRLRGKHLKDFLNNSLLVVNQVNIDLDKYFSKQTFPGIRIINPNTQETTMNSPNRTAIESPDNSANRIKQPDESVELKEDIEKFKEIGPTRLDFDSLTVAQQIQYDKRSPCCIFATQTLRNHTYLNVFCYDYLLIPLHIRQFLLMTVILVGMSLNAFFYTDTLINNRAKAKDAVP